MRTKKVTKKRAVGVRPKTVVEAKNKLRQAAIAYARGDTSYTIDGVFLESTELDISLEGIRQLAVHELYESERALLCVEIINSLSPVYLAAVMADIAGAALAEVTVEGSLTDEVVKKPEFEEENEEDEDWV